MTSKEALEYFLEFSRFNNACILSCDECPNKLCNIKRAYEEIRNDLNMLEGLKKDYLELSHEWQKDLNVLNIFKKYFFIKISDTSTCDEFYYILLKDKNTCDYIGIYVNKEEKDLLKEFLEK